jgi:hypothetical protein
VNPEVGLPVFDDQPGRRFEQGRTHAFDRQVRLLRRRGNGRGDGQQARETGDTKTHTVRTRRLTIRPVQENSHGIG